MAIALALLLANPRALHVEEVRDPGRGEVVMRLIYRGPDLIAPELDPTDR
ncbi:MAG: hypothetical protein KDC38_03830 [Planctomycetes bacterium]|nr:hypothetical protein [Planctomycetota bacterium]